MPVVFSTDFSPLARELGCSVALMAERLHEPLELLHIVNPGLRDLTDDSPWAWREFAEAQLELERARLGPLSVPIEQQILEGPPEKVLVRHIEQIGARAVVLPAAAPHAKAASPRAWFAAPRYALACRAPVLLVRDPSALRDWLRDQHALKVMVGVDRSPASRSVIAWLAELRRLGRCDILVESVYWPPEEHERFGLRGPMGVDSPDPVEPMLLRDLKQLVGELPGEGTLRLQVHGGYGRPAAHLLAHAVAEEVELLVFGSPGTTRRLLRRPSVAHQLIARAPMSLASVCTREAVPRSRPGYRAVLVAAHPEGDAGAAFEHALRVVEPYGKVHVLQVIRKRVGPAARRRSAMEHHSADDTGRAPSAGRTGDRLTEELLTRARRSPRRGMELSFERVEHRDPAIAIAQAAERMGADLVCMAAPATDRRGRRMRSEVTSRVARSADRALLVLG